MRAALDASTFDWSLLPQTIQVTIQPGVGDYATPGNVYVDPQSTQYLTGSEIDYLDTLMGAGFTVNNPNAVSACGCGSSFRTSDSAGSPGACHH